MNDVWESEMKRLLFISVLLFASLLYSQRKFDINNLIDSGGLKYAPNDDEPYTGKVLDFYENGQKKFDGNYRKGLMNGEWTYYHENGKFHAQGRFIDGDGSNSSESSGIPFNGRTGRWSFWYENGKKKSEGTYNDGEIDGKWTEWFENGQLSEEETFKDGELNGKSTYWYENGQKAVEGTYKDGELDGLYTEWYENGQKEYEGTFKDGKEDGLSFRWYDNGQKM